MWMKTVRNEFVELLLKSPLTPAFPTRSATAVKPAVFLDHFKEFAAPHSFCFHGYSPGRNFFFRLQSMLVMEGITCASLTIAVFIFGFDNQQEKWKSISISGDLDRSNAAPTFERGKLKASFRLMMQRQQGQRVKRWNPYKYGNYNTQIGSVRKKQKCSEFRYYSVSFQKHAC